MTRKEFEVCVNDLSDDLLRYFIKNTCPVEQADDLVQETFIALWSNIQKVEKAKAKSWLFTVAHNKMMTYFRDEKLHKQEASTSFATNDNFDNEQLIDFILQSLDARARQCLMLKDWEGFSIKEIADILQMSENNIKQIIFRAKIKIKKIIDNKQI